MRDVHKHVMELLLLVPAFALLIPPVPSTNEPYTLLPGLAIAALAFSGSLLIAIRRGVETWAAATTKLVLFLAFGWVLHVRVAITRSQLGEPAVEIPLRSETSYHRPSLGLWAGRSTAEPGHEADSRGSIMAFKSAIWYPIAVGLSVINVLGAAFAVGDAEPLHASVHVALAVAFGFWARRLRQGRGTSERQAPLEAPGALDALEAEVNRLREELSETQERVDFAERLLTQKPEPRRADPQR